MPSRRALIIASPFEGLRGTLNDAKDMAGALQNHGFDITECYSSSATRSGILEAWKQLIAATRRGDSVVIYYSGHGGIVQAPEKDKSTQEKGARWRCQFLVPVDYDQTTDDDFRGILDVEISYMLRDTTNKTPNVTIILDCCHSGRLFRAPGYGDQARPKNLLDVQYHSTVEHLTRLRDAGHFRREADDVHGETTFSGNPHAVRIAAAASPETAWEYLNSRGKWTGALTEALVRVLDESRAQEVSWRTILFRVRHLVGSKFREQHPQAEGPETRALFSMNHVLSGALHLKFINALAVLDGGSVVGVRKGNVYLILPFDSQASVGEQAPEATVTAVAAFKAKVELTSMPAWAGVEQDGALAILKHEAVGPKLVAAVPLDLPGLCEAVSRSRYLCCRAADQVEPASLEFRQTAHSIALRNSWGIQLGSRPINEAHGEAAESFSDIVAVAEQFARAQRVLDLQCQRDADRLEHMVAIEIGVVVNGQPNRQFQKQGNDHVEEQERIYIHLRNDGRATVYISIFDINVARRVSLLNPDEPWGIELPAGRPRILGSDDFGELEGLGVSWPAQVPKHSPIEERFLFVLSSSPVDLRYLAESVNYDLAIKRDTSAATTAVSIQYDIVHIPFTVRPLGFVGDMPYDFQRLPPPQSANPAHREMEPASVAEDKSAISAQELPDPQSVSEGKSLPAYPPIVASKGIIGGILRASIPACVWVVNGHDEEITVVVSKYRPNRMLAGISLNASATGGGLDFSTTTFCSRATRKTLAPRDQSPASSRAVFPLWTRKEGFGVITIFRGPEKTLYIENDHIPLGATAYFINTPDLKLVPYGSDEQVE